MFKDTGVMCLLTVDDSNNADGFTHVDIGNYYINTETKQKCVITDIENAKKYGDMIDVPIYVFK